MDTALVTGASAGSGLTIAKRLVAMGLRVYGLDADFSQCLWKHEHFQPVECDLFRQEKVALAWKTIINEAPNLSILVHAAKADVPGPLESAHPDDIRRALEGRLITPVLLTRYALPRLIRIRGSIFFLSNDTAEALDQVIGGGVGALAQSLFHEVRDTGVKVCHISLSPNHDTHGSPSHHTTIDPELVAEALENALRLPAHNSLTTLTIRPQATREEPFKAASTPLLRWGPEEVRLPARDKFPEEPELIPTPKRQRPADAPEPDEDEDEEDEDDELDRLIEASRLRLKEQAQRHPGPGRHRQEPSRQPEDRKQGQPAPFHEDDGSSRHKRRRRRRGGRNRNREHAGGDHSRVSPPQGEVKPKDQAESGELQATPKPSLPPESSAPKTVEQTTDSPAEKQPKAAKKAVKKTARKAATKKAAKKAVRKKVDPAEDK